MTTLTTTTATLTEPFLDTGTCRNDTDPNMITTKKSSSSSSSSPFSWPEDVAKRVKLLTPAEYADPYEQTRSTKSSCYLKYDKEHNAFLIVASADPEEEEMDNPGSDGNAVLDIIDPDDVIGVRIEIELSAKTALSPSLPSPPDETHDRLLDGGDNDTRATNEPQSDTPVDTHGSAVLHLFVYPRKDLTKKESILTSCNLFGSPSSSSTNTNKPNLLYPASDDNMNADNDKSTTKPKFGHRYEHHRRFVVAPAEDMNDLNIVVDAIRQIIHPHKVSETTKDNQTDERHLVLANPCSGNKAAVQIYNDVVAPMLEQAGIDHDFVVTTHARHAEELMRERRSNSNNTESDNNVTVKDIAEYTGIITVGGDGIVHEVFQGIHSRSDRMEIINNIKFGMVGAGTSNGLSASLAHASDEHFSPTDSTFMIAKGLTSRMDLSHYETSSQSYTSFLTFSWGIIADIDIESECIRWLGFLRMDVWGAIRTLFLRKYRAKFWYLPPSAPGAAGATTATATTSSTDSKSTENSTNRPSAVTLPPLDEPLPEINGGDNNNKDGWVYCEDEFVLFWASQVTHAGEKMFHSPPCNIDDGLFHVFIVRGNVSRLRLALILLTMEHGGHVDMDGVEFIECVAYRLEPLSNGSFNDLDGEVIEPGKIQASVLPSAIQAYYKGKQQ